MKPPGYYEAPEDKPKTETIPKTLKKSFINWLVPTLCAAVGLAFFTLGKSWADDRYTQRALSDVQHSQLSKRMDDEDQKREALQSETEDMNRKLDLIIYILQHDDKIDPKILRPTP